MKVVSNLFGLLLTVTLVLGIFSAAAMAAAPSNPGFYLHSPQNVSIETGQFYTISAQAGNSVLVYAPFAKPVVYNYQWFNVTSGRLVAITGADSKNLVGIAGSPGNYIFDVIATTQQGVSLLNSTMLTVTSVPTIAIIPNSIKLDQGQIYKFKSNYTPGAGNASYAWNVSSLRVSSHCTFPSNTTCTISTENAVPGSYNVTLTVRDGNEPGYEFYPVSSVSKVQIAPAPTISANVINADLKGNVTYGVHLVNGTGPFNVSIYTNNGTIVDSEKILATNQTVLMFFPAPAQTTTYYASANDLGVSEPYVFNSATNTIVVPPQLAVAGSSTNAILLVIVIILVIVIVAVYIDSRSGREGNDGTITNMGDTYGTTPPSDEDNQDSSFSAGGEVYESKAETDVEDEKPEEEEQPEKQEDDAEEEEKPVEDEQKDDEEEKEEEPAEDEEEEEKKPKATKKSTRKKPSKSKKSQDDDSDD